MATKLTKPKTKDARTIIEEEEKQLILDVLKGKEYMLRKLDFKASALSMCGSFLFSFPSLYEKRRVPCSGTVVKRQNFNILTLSPVFSF